MKKIQKVLSVLLTAAMLLGLLSGLSVAYAASVTSDSGSCGTSVSYMYSNGTLFIYGSGRMADYNLGGAPWNSYASEIKKVEISSNVQNVGAAAFANLTSCLEYKIPATVTEIGQYAFVFNSSLPTISMPGVLSIGSNAFVGCEALTSASYPSTANVMSGNDALIKAAGGGSSSSGPTIPSDSLLFTSGVDRGIKWKLYTEGTMVISPEYSGQMAYMPVYTSQGNMPWAMYTSYVKTIIIDENILSISDYAFANMNTVTSVYINQGTTSIGTGAFMGCTSLQKLEFSQYLKTVADYAFYSCTSLSQVITPLTASQLTIGSGNELLISAMNKGTTPGTPTPPTGSTSGQIAGTHISWSISAGMLTVTSTAGNEAVPNYASAPAPWSAYATQITSLKLNGITQIGYYAFAGMTRLTSVDFGSAATEILSYAFQNAVSLQALTLPASLRSIQAYAFDGVTSVIATTPNPEVLMDVAALGNNITMRFSYSAGTPSNPSNPSNPGTIPGIGDIQPSSPTGSCGSGVFYAYDETSKKMVISGNGAITAYGDAWNFPWFGFASYIKEIEIKEGITSIPPRAFYTTGEMTKITIPKTVTSIGAYAFYLSNKLTTVIIDNMSGAVTIDKSGNYNMYSIATYLQNSPSTPGVEQPEGIKYNGFIENTSITWSFNTYTGELLIRSTQTGGENMPDYSDYNSNLGSSYTTNIAPWAHLATLVRKVTLQGITHVGQYAFSDMKSLTTVSFAGTTRTIGSFAFARDTAITHMTFPMALVMVQHSAFSECSLQTVATTPLKKDVTISVGANNNITFQYEVAGSSSLMEGYITGTNILWSFDKTTGVLTVESTAGVEDIPDMVSGAAPWQEIAGQVLSLKMRSIKTIGDYAFSRMTSLMTVDFAAETTTIGVGAFMKATSLRSLTFGPMLTVIEPYAFEDCTINATSPNAQGSINTNYGNSGLTITYGQNSGVGSGNNISGTSIYWTCQNGTLTIQSIATSGEAIPNYASSAAVPWSSHRYNVTKVVMSGITRIGTYAFADMPYLREVVYASNTSEVASYAFANCTSLKSQSLPAALTTIGYYAYNNCTNLATTTPNTQWQMIIASTGNEGLVWSWSQGSGSGNSQTTSGYISGTTISWNLNTTTGVLTLTSTAAGGEALPDTFASYPWSAETVKDTVKSLVLNGITDIGFGAFIGLSNLTQITFGNTTRSIGQAAFAKATSLRTLTLPASLTSIHTQAFTQCGSITAYTPNSQAQMINASNVQNVTFQYGQVDPNPNPNPNPDPGVDTPTYSGTITGSHISWVYHSASMQLTVSSSISGGEALTSFSGADKTPWAHLAGEIISLRLVNIKSIGKYAFAGLSKLASVTFADNTLTSIDQYAFYNAKALKSVALGSAVTNIEANAFAGCTVTIDTPNYQNDVTFSTVGNTGVSWNYKKYDYSSFAPISGTDLEWRVRDNVLNILGDGVIPDYASADKTPWAAIADQITKISIFGEVTGIGAYAFAGMTSLKDVALPNSVTAIKAGAFKGCSALTEFQFPTALTTIGDYAFSGCSKLGNLTLPATLTSIGREAFYDCGAIAEIDFMSTSKLTIGSSAFAGCTSLTKAVRPNATELVIDAEGNDALEKALRPDSVSGTTTEGISWNADCVNGMLTLRGNGAVTDAEAFKPYLPYIKAIIFESGITEIGEALLKDAAAVETVVLPKTLTKIGAEAFAGCTS
ncbi:MAG: leucine-rich repeat protein, partial [Clostridia bacterium]|nr:leucine-rich repeat protein [Clostridia bacterium]